MDRKEKLIAAIKACPIYGITGGTRDVALLVTEMLSAGIRIIQYREKGKTPLLRYQEAMMLRELTSSYQALLVIDDYVDLAMAVQADGVHVGQDDLLPQTVRQLVGSDMLIGWSTHNMVDLKMANHYKEMIDYIGVGPIFATQTKPNAYPVGLSYMHLAKQFSNIPIVAIGGITTMNVASVWEVEPDLICAVSEIVESNDIQNTVRHLMSGHRKVREDFLC